MYFASAADFRAWLKRHHATVTELLVGFHRKVSGRGGLTYQAALDEALCFGWIDGVRKRFDEHSYTIRFSPRKSRSVWSLVNVRHAERLIAAQKMQPAGMTAFAARDPKKTGIYSFERQRPAKLPREFEQRFRAVRPAWEFFRAQAPWYQRVAIYKVNSGKQLATRERWLERLIADSAAGRRLAETLPKNRQ
jgi:uncharacterized protein YdeI (YjbR/CyaY-like superfamily)